MFEWEEGIFHGLKALYGRMHVRPKEQRRREIRAQLSDERGALVMLAQMVAGQTIPIFETDNRRLCGDGRVFLPTEFSLASTSADNSELYHIKTVIAALAIRESWHAEGEALPGLVERCRDEFPGLAAKTDRLSAALGEIDLWFELGALPVRSADAVAKDVALALPATEIEASEITTEIQGRGQSEVEVVDAQDEDGEGSELPTHTFEKVETLEEQTGLERKTDAEDDLEEHAEALDEVDMTQVIRSAERPKSIYRSDIILDGIGLEVGEDGAGVGVPYPEWDYKKKAYKDSWCFLNESSIEDGDAAWTTMVENKHRSLIQQLKRQFAAMSSDWLKLKRQPNGNEFDIDAVVDGQVELRSGHTPDENIYQDRKRDIFDMSVLVLLDVSYSTDAWLNDKRVLDTIRETVFCMGEVMDEHVASFAVAGFSSNTRRSCRFEFVKNFNEPWATARDNLGCLDPAGYTRIGPALRHAQELMINEKGRRKVIILITDGRPCDYDRYEGTYGIHDVKKAIETGRQYQVLTHAFVVEKKAEEYFPRMFTGRHFDIVSRPDLLNQTLCRLFTKLIAH